MNFGDCCNTSDDRWHVLEFLRTNVLEIIVICTEFSFFCTELPFFCIVFPENCISLSQSESKNFFMHIISFKIITLQKSGQLKSTMLATYFIPLVCYVVPALREHFPHDPLSVIRVYYIKDPLT